MRHNNLIYGSNKRERERERDLGISLGVIEWKRRIREGKHESFEIWDSGGMVGHRESETESMREKVRD